jgi:molecular chaperone DnaK (HSP70)
MREAAFDAGYIESLDSDNLMFCHEPVAAAFSLVKRFEKILTRDSKALVVDAGGGTVDFFMCKLTGDNEMFVLISLM